jgi:hypothetical protein
MFDVALTKENIGHIIILELSNSNFESTVHLYIGKTGTKM